MLLLAGAVHVQAAEKFPGIGRPATPAEIAAWDIDVRPDFKGLPPGSGTVAQGQVVWEAKCESCHGTFGESNEVFSPIVGGTTADDIRTGHVKALREPVPRTTLMKVSTVSTLWDYINRAMPWNAPKSLSHDEVYAVLAYLLNLGDIVPADFTLNEKTIRDVQARLPNRNGKVKFDSMWVAGGKGDTSNVACMKDCRIEIGLASALPDFAAGTHGNLADQQRIVGSRATVVATAPAERTPAPPKTAGASVQELARKNNCTACHQMDKKSVGPGLLEIAAKYKADSGAEAKLIEKVKKGGSGVWGPIPMPPNALREEDIRALVRWILAGAPVK
ncbi:MAG: c-type cytochrome [Betaproteobacteria bacterium]